MKGKVLQKSLLLYTSAHFFVDYICAYLILGRIPQDGLFPAFLILYNFCAFAVQMPLGVVSDMLEGCDWLSVCGTGILAFLVFPGGILSIPPAVLAALAGLANAMFHIGCGTQILRSSNGSCRDSGIFVSSGALGLYLGGKSAGMGAGGSAFCIPALCMYLIFLLMAIGSIISGPDIGNDFEKAATFSYENAFYDNYFRYMFCLCALAAVVVLRSYLGWIVNFSWKKEYPLLLVCCIVLGKMFGGVLSDLFGETRLITVSLFLSAILFLVSSNLAAGAASMLLFNMTMPVTLVCMAGLTGKPGFAFGLLTFALYIGCLPVLTGQAPSSFMPLLYAAISLLSLVLMLAVWKIMER